MDPSALRHDAPHTKHSVVPGALSPNSPTSLGPVGCVRMASDTATEVAGGLRNASV